MAAILPFSPEVVITIYRVAKHVNAVLDREGVQKGGNEVYWEDSLPLPADGVT